MRNDSLPIRDVTVGALLSRLADALPDREALVYTHAGARWTFRALERRSAPGRARADRARREARRPRRGVGDQRAGVDRPAVRAGEDRRDSRHRQHGAARAGDRVSAAAERNVDARHHRGFRGVDYLDGAARDWCHRQRRCPDGAVAAPRTRGLHRRGLSRRPRSLTTRCAAAAANVPPTRSRCARSGGRSGRRDQHAVHVRHDRLSERRDAVEPQHRQQRLLAWRRALASRRTIACASACRCFTASAASSACSARSRTAPACARSNRSTRAACSRPSSASAARRSTACRRCFSPSSRIRSSSDSI